jgi:hypothetical protein
MQLPMRIAVGNRGKRVDTHGRSAPRTSHADVSILASKPEPNDGAYRRIALIRRNSRCLCQSVKALRVGRNRADFARPHRHRRRSPKAGSPSSALHVLRRGGLMFYKGVPAVIRTAVSSTEAAVTRRHRERPYSIRRPRAAAGAKACHQTPRDAHAHGLRGACRAKELRKYI